MAFSRLLSKALTEKEGTKSIGGLLSTADAPAKAAAPAVEAAQVNPELPWKPYLALQNPYQAFNTVPGYMEGSGESAYWVPESYTVNQDYFDWINANKGQAPTAAASWVPASGSVGDANSVNPGSNPNQQNTAGGFWLEPDPDGNGWGSQLSSGVTDFLQSPVALPILAMTGAGLAAAGSGGAAGLAAATEAASAPLAVGGMSAEAAAAMSAIPEFTVAPGLMGAGSGLLAAQQAAAAPLTAGGMSAEAAAAMSAVPDFAVANVGSGLAAAQQAAAGPIEVGPMSPEAASAINSTPGLPAAMPTGLAQATQQAQAPLTAGPMSPEAAAAISNTPQLGSTGLLGSLASAGGDALKFLKDNPTLGRLLLSGAGALLNTVGSGSSGSGGASAPVYGAPVQWNSSPTALGQATSGLLAPQVKQLNPQLPGLLGNPNSGAWRFMKG